MLKYPRNLEVHRNSSGFRGVERRQTNGKFRARIYPDSDYCGISLGYYDTAVEAAEAYDQAARRIYGADACLNFPRAGEMEAKASQFHEGLCPQGHDLNKHGYIHPRGTNCRKCNCEAVLRSRRKRREEEAMKEMEGREHGRGLTGGVLTQDVYHGAHSHTTGSPKG